MLISFLILWPLLGIFIVYTLNSSYETDDLNTNFIKKTALFFSLVEILISLIIWFLFDNASKHFQFVQEQHTIGHYDIYLGLDGLSIYFVLLTTFIISISILSNWRSIDDNSVYFLVIMLLLESALLLVYSVLDLLMFYVFFESILAPLFVLIGLFGSKDKLRAGFYLFLYTLLGSLFMLLSIITVYSLTGSTDMDIINYTNYTYITQVFLFIGIFIAFAVKTPVIFLNSWLLKAHVESPLSGSVILAAIVLKLSLYGVFRLILPLVPKAFMYYTYIVFVICVITILYASFSTIRTIDVKELIAYSSVSHAVVYLGAVFSNVIQGIQGGILLGLAHGFVSSGLFISAGGILYDRSHTRTIYYYGGLAQIMPLFSVLFFILCLGNCGTPLTLNFVGEFMSLYGIFERIPLVGMFASTSIVLSAAYTIFMYNRISLGGSFRYWLAYMSDLKFREIHILTILVVFTVFAGIYPSIFLDSLHYVSTNLLFNGIIYNDTFESSALFLQDDGMPEWKELDYVTLGLIIFSPVCCIMLPFLIYFMDIINTYIIIYYDIILNWFNPVFYAVFNIIRILAAYYGYIELDLHCKPLSYVDQIPNVLFSEGKNSDTSTDLIEDSKETDTGDGGSKTSYPDNNQAGPSKRPHPDNDQDDRFKKPYPVDKDGSSKRPKLEIPKLPNYDKNSGEDLSPNCHHGDQEKPHEGPIAGVGSCGCTRSCSGAGVLETQSSRDVVMRQVWAEETCCVCANKGILCMCSNCNCGYCQGCLSGGTGPK